MNLNKVITLFIIAAIICISIFLRFYKLTEIPAGLYVDEATTGYNAFSILKTGKDEYGKTFPVLFKLFGSYSPPLYIYLTVPLISLFGMSAYSVRFVSVISGLLIVLIVYLFIRQFAIFQKNTKASLLIAMIFSISPWSVFYSRAGYEVNLGLMLFSFGVLLVWMGFKKHIYLSLGIATLSLSTYAAHTQIFLVPLFILGLIIVFFKQVFSKNTIRYLVIGILLALFIQLPYLSIITTPAFWTKSSLFYSKDILSQAVKISYFLPFPIGILLGTIHHYPGLSKILFALSGTAIQIKILINPSQ